MLRYAGRTTRRLNRPSEGTLEKLFSITQNGVAYLDRSFRLIVVNQAFSQAGGRELDDYRGNNFFDLFPDPQMEAIFQQVLETGRPYQAFSADLKHFQGAGRSVLFWDWSLRPVPGPDGQVANLVLEMIDVTTHEETRRALQKTRALFVHLFESTPDASILLDNQGSIIAINLAAETLFGYSRQEIAGQPVEILIPEKRRAESRPFQIDQRQPDLPNPSASQPEVILRRKNGAQFPAEIDLTPFLDDNQQMALSIVRDISERKLRDDEMHFQTELVRLLQDVAIAANEADNLTAAFQFTINRLGSFLGWPLGHAYLIEDHKNLVPTAIWNDKSNSRFSVFRAVSEALTFKPGDGLPGIVLQTQQAVWLNDLPTNPNFNRTSEALQSGLKTGLAIPIMANREVVGMLEFFHELDIPPHPRLLAVLPHIGVQLGRVMECSRAAEALRKSAAQLQLVVTNLPVILLVVDHAMRLILLEGKDVQAAGLDPHALVGKSVEDLLVDQPALLNLFRRVFSGEEIHTEIDTAQGRPFEIYLTPYYDANRTVEGLIGLAFDISQRKEMEAELEEIKHRLLESVEAERARLGQRLHDGPLQDLFGAYYQIQEVMGSLNPEENQVANRVLETIQQVNATLRVISGELRPSALVHLGLRKAILSYADLIKSHLDDVEIHFDLPAASTGLPYNRRLGLFRVYQQLLGNAVRHAKASHIWVRIRLDPKEITLEVQDDGTGFTLPKNWIELVRKGRFGLASSLERLHGMQGELKIKTLPGQGTLVQAVMPRELSDLND